MVIEQDAKLIQQRRKSTSSLLQNTSKLQLQDTNKNNHQIINNQNQISENSNLVLQQLRVALKKLPEAKITVNGKLTTGLASLKTGNGIEAVKRRHSDCGLISNLLNSSNSNNDPHSEVKKVELVFKELNHFIIIIHPFFPDLPTVELTGLSLLWFSAFMAVFAGVGRTPIIMTTLMEHSSAQPRKCSFLPKN